MLSLVLLGDSIAFGQGADRPADTIGGRLVAALQAQGTVTQLWVHAVPGAVSAGLASQVQAALVGPVDVAVIIIGANDLTHLVPIPVAVAQLSQAVRALRKYGAQVVVLPAPDLAAVPFMPAQFRALVRAASSQLRAAQTQTALDDGARVAPVEDISAEFATDPGLFASDWFHPSSRGYEVIARALLPAVLDAAHT